MLTRSASYPDRETAQWATQQVVTANEQAIHRWLAQNTRSRLTIETAWPSREKPVGRVQLEAELLAGWSEDQPFPSHHTLGSPALAVFQNRLYCAHRGGSGDWGIALTSQDSGTWTPDQPVPHAESVYGPALAVFRDALHLAYADADADAAQRIMVTTSQDGRSWTAPEPVPGCAATRSPALAVYNDALHLLHSNLKDGAIHWSHLHGTRWTSEGALPGHRTRSNIGLVMFDGKLMCVHRDPSRQQLWWSTFDGARWSTDTEMPNHHSKYGPALALHRDAAGTHHQLLCVHRGHAQRFVTAAGEVLTDEDPAGLHELDDPGSSAD